MSDARTNGYIRFISRRPSKVVISFITLVAFLFNTVSYDIAWADRTPSAPTSVGADSRAVSPVSPGAFKELNAGTFVLPQSLGTIKDSWSSAPVASSKGQVARTVVHIQDAHCNYYAQHAISDIVEYLNKEYGISEINLEGGAKDYDLSIFTSIKDNDERERIADYFVKEGLVNGAEYFAVNNPGKAKLWGIEDTKLYIDNLRVYRNSLKYKPDTDKLLANLNNILTNLKMKLYSKELLELDLKYNQYKANNLEFKDYLNYLIANAKEKLVNIKSFNNIFLLSQSLKAEEEIDFGKANSQRDELIDKLQKRLSKNAMKELIEKTVAFRAGLIPQEEFYALLLNKAKPANISIENYPELEKYIVYISTYAAVDKAKIIDEVTTLETRLRELLYQNDKQRELDKLSKNLAILKNIFNISLTRADYRYYKTNESAFDMKNYISFIDSCRGGLNLPYNGVSAKDLTRLDGYRKEMSKFYEYSFKRDTAFIKNLVIARSPAVSSGATKQSQKSAILITGGFHSENLTELLKKQGTSYISIVPNFRNGEDYQCPYIQILSGMKNVKVTQMVQNMLAQTLAPPDGFSPDMVEAYNKAFPEDAISETSASVTLPTPEVPPVITAPSAAAGVDVLPPAGQRLEEIAQLIKTFESSSGSVEHREEAVGIELISDKGSYKNVYRLKSTKGVVFKVMKEGRERVFAEEVQNMRNIINIISATDPNKCEIVNVEGFALIKIPYFAPVAYFRTMDGRGVIVEQFAEKYNPDPGLSDSIKRSRKDFEAMRLRRILEGQGIIFEDDSSDNTGYIMLEDTGEYTPVYLEAGEAGKVTVTPKGEEKLNLTAKLAVEPAQKLFTATAPSADALPLENPDRRYSAALAGFPVIFYTFIDNFPEMAAYSVAFSIASLFLTFTVHELSHYAAFKLLGAKEVELKLGLKPYAQPRWRGTYPSLLGDMASTLAGVGGELLAGSLAAAALLGMATIGASPVSCLFLLSFIGVSMTSVVVNLLPFKGTDGNIFLKLLLSGKYRAEREARYRQIDSVSYLLDSIERDKSSSRSATQAIENVPAAITPETGEPGLLATPTAVAANAGLFAGMRAGLNNWWNSLSVRWKIAIGATLFIGSGALAGLALWGTVPAIPFLATLFGTKATIGGASAALAGIPLLAVPPERVNRLIVNEARKIDDKVEAATSWAREARTAEDIKAAEGVYDEANEAEIRQIPINPYGRYILGIAIENAKRRIFDGITAWFNALIQRTLAALRVKLDKASFEDSVRAIEEMRKGIERLYEGLLNSRGIRNNREKQQKLERLFRYVFERLMAQETDDLRLPFTPHGAKHSYDVAEYMKELLDRMPSLRRILQEKYSENYETIVVLLGLLHDIGYAKLLDAVKELGKDEKTGEDKVKKGYHADLGAEMVEKDIGDIFRDLFGMDEAALKDFIDAIRLHGADKKSVTEEGPKGSGKHAYTPASETDNPLLLLIRLADNLDISRGRLRSWQQNPWFMRMLHHMAHDTVLQSILADKSITEEERARRIDARLDRLKVAMLESLRKRKDAAGIIRSFEDGRSSIKEVCEMLGIETVSAAELRNILRSLNAVDEETFAEIRTALEDMDNESFGHFIGALAVREVRIEEDGDGNVRIVAELTDEAARDENLRKYAEFQVNGKGRSNDALRSLTVNGKNVQIEIQYGVPKTLPSLASMAFINLAIVQSHGPFNINQAPDAAKSAAGKGVIWLLKKTVLFLLGKLGIKVSEETYDNIMAPMLEELLFTALPLLLLPHSFAAFTLFRAAFIILHLFAPRAPSEKGQDLVTFTMNRLLAPTIISLFAIYFGNVLSAIVSHMIINVALPDLNRRFGLNLRKGVLGKESELARARNLAAEGRVAEAEETVLAIFGTSAKEYYDNRNEVTLPNGEVLKANVEDLLLMAEAGLDDHAAYRLCNIPQLLVPLRKYKQHMLEMGEFADDYFDMLEDTNTDQARYSFKPEHFFDSRLLDEDIVAAGAKIARLYGGKYEREGEDRKANFVLHNFFSLAGKYKGARPDLAGIKTVIEGIDRLAGIGPEVVRTYMQMAAMYNRDNNGVYSDTPPEEYTNPLLTKTVIDKIAGLAGNAQDVENYLMLASAGDSAPRLLEDGGLYDNFRKLSPANQASFARYIYNSIATGRGEVVSEEAFKKLLSEDVVNLYNESGATLNPLLKLIAEFPQESDSFTNAGFLTKLQQLSALGVGGAYVDALIRIGRNDKAALMTDKAVGIVSELAKKDPETAKDYLTLAGTARVYKAPADMPNAIKVAQDETYLGELLTPVFAAAFGSMTSAAVRKGYVRKTAETSMDNRGAFFSTGAVEVIAVLNREDVLGVMTNRLSEERFREMIADNNTREELVGMLRVSQNNQAGVLKAAEKDMLSFSNTRLLAKINAIEDKELREDLIEAIKSKVFADFLADDTGFVFILSLIDHRQKNTVQCFIVHGQRVKAKADLDAFKKYYESNLAGETNEAFVVEMMAALLSYPHLTNIVDVAKIRKLYELCPDTAQEYMMAPTEEFLRSDEIYNALLGLVEKDKADKIALPEGGAFPRIYSRAWRYSAIFVEHDTNVRPYGHQLARFLIRATRNNPSNYSGFMENLALLRNIHPETLKELASSFTVYNSATGVERYLSWNENQLANANVLSAMGKITRGKLDTYFDLVGLGITKSEDYKKTGETIMKLNEFLIRSFQCYIHAGDRESVGELIAMCSNDREVAELIRIFDAVADSLVKWERTKQTPGEKFARMKFLADYMGGARMRALLTGQLSQDILVMLLSVNSLRSKDQRVNMTETEEQLLKIIFSERFIKNIEELQEVLGFNIPRLVIEMIKNNPDMAEEYLQDGLAVSMAQNIDYLFGEGRRAQVAEGATQTLIALINREPAKLRSYMEKFREIIGREALDEYMAKGNYNVLTQWVNLFDALSANPDDIKSLTKQMDGLPVSGRAEYMTVLSGLAGNELLKYLIRQESACLKLWMSNWGAVIELSRLLNGMLGYGIAEDVATGFVVALLQCGMRDNVYSLRGLQVVLGDREKHVEPAHIEKLLRIGNVDTNTKDGKRTLLAVVEALKYMSNIISKYSNRDLSPETKEILQISTSRITAILQGDFDVNRTPAEMAGVEREFMEALLKQVTGVSEINAEIFKDEAAMQELLTVCNLYYSLATHPVSNRQLLRDTMVQILKVYVSTKGDRNAARKAIMELSDNAKEVEKLLKAGYQRLLWDNGVEVRQEVVPLSQNKMLEQIQHTVSQEAHQIIEIVQQMEYRPQGMTEEDMQALSFSTYEEAEQFARDMQKVTAGRPGQEEKMRTVNGILENIKRIEAEGKQKALASRPTKVKIVIKKDFLDEASAGVGVPGCFSPNGIHREMPVVHALEANAFFARVYDEETGEMFANAVLVLTDQGVVVFGVYNSRADLDLGLAWLETWKELSRVAPAVILRPVTREDRTAGREYAEKAGVGRRAELTVRQRATLFGEMYYDFGKCDSAGNWSLTGKDLIILESAMFPKAEKAPTGEERAPPTTEKAQPKPEDVLTVLSKEDRKTIRNELFDLKLDLELGPLLANLDRMVLGANNAEVDEAISRLKLRSDRARAVDPNSEDLKKLKAKLKELITRYRVSKAVSYLAGELERMRRGGEVITEDFAQTMLFNLLTTQMNLDLNEEEPAAQEGRAVIAQPVLPGEIVRQVDAMAAAVKGYRSPDRERQRDKDEELFGEYIPLGEQTVASGEIWIDQNERVTLKRLGRQYNQNSNDVPPQNAVLQFELYRRSGQLYMEVIDIISKKTQGFMRINQLGTTLVQRIADIIGENIVVTSETAMFNTRTTFAQNFFRLTPRNGRNVTGRLGWQQVKKAQSLIKLAWIKQIEPVLAAAGVAFNPMVTEGIDQENFKYYEKIVSPGIAQTPSAAVETALARRSVSEGGAKPANTVEFDMGGTKTIGRGDGQWQYYTIDGNGRKTVSSEPTNLIIENYTNVEATYNPATGKFNAPFAGGISDESLARLEEQAKEATLIPKTKLEKWLSARGEKPPEPGTVASALMNHVAVTQTPETREFDTFMEGNVSALFMPVEVPVEGRHPIAIEEILRRCGISSSEVIGILIEGGRFEVKPLGMGWNRYVNHVIIETNERKYDVTCSINYRKDDPAGYMRIKEEYENLQSIAGKSPKHFQRALAVMMYEYNGAKHRVIVKDYIAGQDITQILRSHFKLMMTGDDLSTVDKVCEDLGVCAAEVFTATGGYITDPILENFVDDVNASPSYACIIDAEDFKGGLSEESLFNLVQEQLSYIERAIDRQVLAWNQNLATVLWTAYLRGFIRTYSRTHNFDSELFINSMGRMAPDVRAIVGDILGKPVATKPATVPGPAPGLGGVGFQQRFLDDVVSRMNSSAALTLSEVERETILWGLTTDEDLPAEKGSSIVDQIVEVLNRLDPTEIGVLQDMAARWVHSADNMTEKLSAALVRAGKPVAVKPTAAPVKTARDEVTGRTFYYDSLGRIAEVRDEETDIVWEKHERSGDTQYVTLYNPTKGNRIRLSYDRLILPEMQPTVKIYIEDENGEFSYAGYFTWEVNEKGKEITQYNIEINEEYRSLGIGKTIKQWIALKAAREGKSLKISMTYSPAAAHIDSQLYDYSTLILTEGDWLDEGGKKIEVTAETIGNILEGLGSFEYPIKKALYWEGKVDAAKVAALQNAEAEKRLQRESIAAAPFAARSDAAVKAQKDFIAEFGEDAPEVLRFVSNKGLAPEDIESYRKELIQERQGKEVVSSELTIRGLGTIKFYTKRNNRLPADFVDFSDEAEVMRIAHQNGLGPNAMTISNGTILVMQEAKGKGLDEMLLDEKLLPEKRAETAKAIMYTLGRLHGLGIIHGDVVHVGSNVLMKSNIIISEDGRAIFIDFANAFAKEINRPLKNVSFDDEREALIDALQVEEGQGLKEAYDRGEKDAEFKKEANKAFNENKQEILKRLEAIKDMGVREKILELFELGKTNKETIKDSSKGLTAQDGVNHLKALLVGMKPAWLNFGGELSGQGNIDKFIEANKEALNEFGLDYVPTNQGLLLYDKALVKAILKRDGTAINDYLKDKGKEKINFDNEDERNIIEEMLKADMHLVGIALGYRLEDVRAVIDTQPDKLMDLGEYAAEKHPGLITPFAQLQSVIVRRDPVVAEQALLAYMPVQVGIDRFGEVYGNPDSLLPNAAAPVPSAAVSIAKPILEKNVILSEVDEITGALNEKFEDHGYPAGFANAAIQAFCTEMLQNVDRAGREEGAGSTSARVLLYEYDDGRENGLKISISNNAIANMEAINRNLGTSAEEAAKKLVEAGGTGEEGISGGLGIALVSGLAEKLGGKVDYKVDNGLTHAVMSIPRPGAVALGTTVQPTAPPVTQAVAGVGVNDTVERLLYELVDNGIITSEIEELTDDQDIIHAFAVGKAEAKAGENVNMVKDLVDKIKGLINDWKRFKKMYREEVAVYPEPGEHSVYVNTLSGEHIGDVYMGEVMTITSTSAGPVHVEKRRLESVSSLAVDQTVFAHAVKANAVQANIARAYRNWIVTPTVRSDREDKGRRSPAGKKMIALYNETDGAITTAEYYQYEDGDDEDTFKKNIEDVLRKISEQKADDNLEPMIALFVPSKFREAAKAVVGKEEFNGLVFRKDGKESSMVAILSDTVPPRDGNRIAEAQHIDFGVEWLDYLRNKDAYTQDQKRALADHTRACAANPDELPASAEKVLEGIMNGTIVLKMIGPVNWGEWDKEEEMYRKLRESA